MFWGGTLRVAELDRPLSNLESERKQIEDKLNSIKVDITSMKTGSGRALSSAVMVSNQGHLLSHRRSPAGKVDGRLERLNYRMDDGLFQKHLKGVVEAEANSIMDEMSAAMVAKHKANIN